MPQYNFEFPSHFYLSVTPNTILLCVCTIITLLVSIMQSLQTIAGRLFRPWGAPRRVRDPARTSPARWYTGAVELGEMAAVRRISVGRKNPASSGTFLKIDHEGFEGADWLSRAPRGFHEEFRNVLGGLSRETCQTGCALATTAVTSQPRAADASWIFQLDASNKSEAYTAYWDQVELLKRFSLIPRLNFGRASAPYPAPKWAWRRVTLEKSRRP